MTEPFTAAEDARYAELSDHAKLRPLSPDERHEFQELGARFAEIVSARWAKEAEEKKAQLAKEAEAKRDADAVAKRQQDYDHQVSWLRATLNVKVDEADLRNKWAHFRAQVGDP